MEMWSGSHPGTADITYYITCVYPLSNDNIHFFHVGVNREKRLVLITEIMTDGDCKSKWICQIVTRARV